MTHVLACGMCSGSPLYTPSGFLEALGTVTVIFLVAAVRAGRRRR